MLGRFLLVGVIGGLLWGISLPAPAAGGDLMGWLHGDHRSHTAEYLGDGEPGVGVLLGSWLHLDALVPGPRRSGAAAVPAYRWGYFGAPYCRGHFCHKGYYGDRLWWCYRRR
jgi:hypothetical protein